MFECTSCGACCINSAANQAEGYAYYVEIDDPKSPLLTKKDLHRKYVMEDPDGTPHVRLHPDGRCLALRGKLGQRATCDVYNHRPRGCRLIEPGDANCLRAREERGMGGHPLGFVRVERR
jgi:hypothetical protein